MIITRKDSSNLIGFSKGTFYRPLEVIFNEGSKIFRLVSEGSNVPTLFEGAHFNVIDARFYADWIMAVEGEGKARLTSKEFLEPGFWESYLSGQREAVSIYKRITNPLSAAALSLAFVERVKNIPWASVNILVQNGWLKPALATHLATPKLELPQSSELEVELASLGVRDSARVLEILTFLSPNGEGKREAVLLLAAWGYENRSDLSDPSLFLEDVYLRCFAAAELKPAMPFLNPKLTADDLIVNWKGVLDAYVYGKILTT